MASINGLSIKKLKYFQGMDGKMAQGDLYLGNKKIAFWSQDDCIEDNLDMEPGYSEYRLRQAIIAAHPEKHEEKIAQNGVPYSNISIISVHINRHTLLWLPSSKLFLFPL